MNIYQTFNKLFNTQPRYVATVTGQRGPGKVTAQTPAGTHLILTGEAATNTTVYYNPRTGLILGEAPDVSYSEYGV